MSRTRRSGSRRARRFSSVSPALLARRGSAGPRVPRDQLQPGDIVFFHPSANGPQHEGMYIGGGEFIQAPQTGDVVKVSSLYDTQYALSYVGAVRPYAPAGSVPSPSISGWVSTSG